MAEAFPDNSTNTDAIEKHEREKLASYSPSTLALLLPMDRGLFVRLSERLKVAGLSWQDFAKNGVDRWIKDYTRATEEAARNTALDNLIQKLKEGAGGR